MNTRTPPTPPLRAAFYGSTANDAAPERVRTAMIRQYRKCQRALPDGALVAAFFDPKIEQPRPATSDGQHHSALPVRRDGGLAELLAEVGWPYRPRFNFVIACGTTRLAPDTATLTPVLRRLALAGVEFLIAPWTTSAAATPLPMPYLRCRVYLDVFTTLLREGVI